VASSTMRSFVMMFLVPGENLGSEGNSEGILEGILGRTDSASRSTASHWAGLWRATKHKRYLFR
jgi:hypothetical protein